MPSYQGTGTRRDAFGAVGMKILQLVCPHHLFSLTHLFPSCSLFSQESPRGTPMLDAMVGVNCLRSMVPQGVGRAQEDWRVRGEAFLEPCLQADSDPLNTGFSIQEVFLSSLVTSLRKCRPHPKQATPVGNPKEWPPQCGEASVDCGKCSGSLTHSLSCYSPLL